MAKKITSFFIISFLLLTTLFSPFAAFANGSLSITWNGRQGLDSQRCDLTGQDFRPETGWIHWVLNQAKGVTEAKLYLGGSGSGEYDYSKRTPGGVFHFYTPYFDLENLTAVVNYYGTLGKNSQFVISDYCPGEFPPNDYEELTVTKTVNTSYVRKHNWSITKDVSPNAIWLYADGSQDTTAVWNVEVDYKDYEDSGFNVSGEIRIENTGTLDANIIKIEDFISEEISADVYCNGISFPYMLEVGQTLNCTYSKDLEEKIEGYNEVQVETERNVYFSEEVEIIWGEPETEIDKTVKVIDESDLFGTQELGEVNAPNSDTFTYEKDFAWKDYGAQNCGDYTYKNTAKIFGDDEENPLGEASSQLDVYVQCYLYKYETAFAKFQGNGTNSTCFIPDFQRWGWTNFINNQYGNYTMDLWAGAGRCNTSKAINVGTVDVSVNGNVNVVFNLKPGYILQEQHVYAGQTKYPQVRQGKRTVFTVAPGQYYIRSPFNYVIVHAVVGIGYPDPGFGM